jgi:hypothetical protein
MANLLQPALPDDSEEVLYRHINPKWLDENGEPSGQAFRPFDESNIHLSVDLSSKLSSPAESAANFKGDSVGIYGVTPKECHSQSLKTYSAPEPGNAAHGAIDYTGVSLNNPAKKKGSALARKARERKRIHPPLNATAVTGTSQVGEAPPATPPTPPAEQPAKT